MQRDNTFKQLILLSLSLSERLHSHAMPLSSRKDLCLQGFDQKVLPRFEKSLSLTETDVIYFQTFVFSSGRNIFTRGIEPSALAGAKVLKSLQISSGNSSLGLRIDELTVTSFLSQDQQCERAEPNMKWGTARAPQQEQADTLTNLQSSFASQVIFSNTQFDGILSIFPPISREKWRTADSIVSHSSKISNKHTAPFSYPKAF